MAKKTMILVFIWLIYSFSEYYILPYFIKPLTWFVICLTLLILSVKEIINIVNNRKNLIGITLLNLLVELSLLVITFYNFNKIPNSIIEKLDWYTSYETRNQIVNDVFKEKSELNSKINNDIYELSFELPIISNGGNDIWIYQNKTDKKKTIKFWISRGYFESPQTYFIFTNDNKIRKQLEDKITENPETNWKLEENWYRIME
jgi:hypothetical protein